MTGVDVVDADTLDWVNGRTVHESMEPAFRDNLDPGGDPDRVADLLSRYWIRSLWLDPTTTRRIDHVRTDPGYVDLSEAYHDSVEECLVLAGEVELSAEGPMAAGDYFWRPPGWVHSARSETGFEAVLMMEGEDPTEGSGRVSRVPHPDDDAGTHHGTQDPDGPRGYVRRVSSGAQPWAPLDDTVMALHADGPTAGAAGALGKVLSENAATGALTALVRLPAGATARPATSDRERFLVVTDGRVCAGEDNLGPGSLVRLAPGATAPELHAPDGVELLVKVGASR